MFVDCQVFAVDSDSRIHGVERSAGDSEDLRGPALVSAGLLQGATGGRSGGTARGSTVRSSASGTLRSTAARQARNACLRGSGRLRA